MKRTEPSLKQVMALLALSATIAVPALADQYATADEMGLMKGFPPPEEKRVGRESLLKGPGNRWAYLNMRTLYPTAGIPKADVAVPVKISIDGAIEKLKIKHPENGQMVSVDTWLEETCSDAVVVVHGNQIVFERYLNGMHADHPHQMMSVTKSFAGLFGLLAVENGLIKESDPVAGVLPELEDSGAFGEATFGHVLDMVNSMDFSEDYADPESRIPLNFAARSWGIYRQRYRLNFLRGTIFPR